MLEYICVLFICLLNSRAEVWFGSSKQYLCHCQTGCSFDGFCLIHGLCDIGWFGFKCQYRNLAVSDTRITPSIYLSTITPSQYKSNITDGDNTTCINNVSLTSLQVSWNIALHFTWLRLKLNEKWNNDIQINFKIDISSTPTITCGNQKLFVIDSTTIDVYCDLNVAVQYIEISGDIVKSICDISISGGRNVALKGAAKQSTTWGERSTSDGFFSASRAVDGYLNGTYNDFPYYASTTEGPDTDPGPYWKVKLTTAFVVNRYLIANRAEAETWYRLQKFALTSSDSNNKNVFTYTDNKEASIIYTIIDANNKALSQVTITQTKKYRADICPIISIVEVEVYGECGPGKWGLECTTCNNNCKDTCNVDGGWCNLSCQGYSNPPVCDIPCRETFWGLKCQQQCNSNCVGRLCNATSGLCTVGCIEGFQPSNCTTACAKGTYGKSCNFTCPANCSNEDCDSKNGNCYSCKSGYSGDKCDQICMSKHYGQNCSQNCSTQCDGELCHHVTGKCSSCISGFRSDFCNETCLNGTYGKNCNNKCSYSCSNTYCDITNGTCFSCIPGLSGDHCEKPCANGTYGKNCKFTCSDYCSNKYCDSMDGYCFSCVPGFIGNQCNETCEKGKYGFNCSKDCSSHCNNTSCNATNGYCYSCIPGYQDSFCETALTKTQEENINVGAIVGAVIGGITFVTLIGLLAVFCYRRRNNQKNKTTKQLDYFNKVSNEDEKEDNPVKPSVPMTTEGIYQNLELPVISYHTSIAIGDLNDFMKSHPTEHFTTEFQALRKTLETLMSVGFLESNRNKNRFKNISPYDHSRVHLEINTQKGEKDYINASYIKGFNNEVKFIAAQGPSVATLNDFIRLLWEQNTEKVVMLTNLIEEGKVKCEQYWPDSDKKTFGDIKVKYLSTQSFADYTIRQLELAKKNCKSHHITQYHFTSWPDKGVPTASWSLVDFEQRVFLTPTSQPIVVHCSAGVGRTGTFIALHNAIKEAEETGQVDFFKTVNKLREDRMNMVQTVLQYEFLHRAAIAAIACIETTISTDNLQFHLKSLEKQSFTGEFNMQEEFKAVCNACSLFQDKLIESRNHESDDNIYQNAQKIVNGQLNRFPDIFADDVYRPLLTCHNTEVGDYINAILLPSFHQKDHQIITQLPMPSTVVDFWRLVTQYNVTLIVAFEVDSMENDPTFGKYLPPTSKDVMLCSPFEIKSLISKDEKLWQEQIIQVSLEKTLKPMDKESHSLIHLKAKFTDFNPESILSFIEEARQNNSYNGRVIFMCKNGALYSGIACVLTLLLDRMDHDGCITVPLIVGSVKSVRPQAISSFEQYKLLYHMLDNSNQLSSKYGHINSGSFKGAMIGLDSSRNLKQNSQEETQVYANFH